jgi:hypothetical protein
MYQTGMMIDTVIRAAMATHSQLRSMKRRNFAQFMALLPYP